MRYGRTFCTRYSVVLVAMAVATTFYSSSAYSSNGFCPGVCTCKWRSGKRSVECNDKGLIAIPEAIDSETQLLDVSNNNLQVLPKETFVRAQLPDLQKVYLRNCRIGQIDDRALVGLSNVVDLDLSYNLLTAVPSSIFPDVPNLRNLSLAYNPIQKIDAFTFESVPSLTKLDLSHCQLTTVSSRAFAKVDYLELLRLNGNRLTELRLIAVDSMLKRLHSIELHDNPWNCDCGMRALKVWLVEKNVPHPIEPLCVEGPAHVHNKSFDQLLVDDFACRPEMKIKPEHRYVESAAGDNATILCKVESIPEATISWYWNGRLLLNNTAFSPAQNIVIHHWGETEKKSMLTLTNAQESDSSQFYCMAENQAGTAEANFTLRVVHRLAGFAVVFNRNPLTSISLLLIGLSVIVLSVIAYLMRCVRKIPSACEVKREEAIANGTGHHSTTYEDKTLNIEPSLAVMKRAYSNFSSSMYDDFQITLPQVPAPVAGLSPFEVELGSKIAASAYYNVYQNTSNPDLIVDTRYQQKALTPSTYNGVYTRSDNMFYPSSLWNRNDLTFQSVTAVDCFQELDSNDRTPIIEKVTQPSSSLSSSSASSMLSSSSSLFFQSSRVPPFSDGEFLPTTSSLLQRDKVDGSSTGASAYGPPNDAKITRVWQKGVQVIPPVTALKRVLNRNSPDEGYQEGCGTDV